MSKLGYCRSRFGSLIIVVPLAFAMCCLASGQVLNQDQEALVHGLPALMAKSDDTTEVLLTSLDTVFNDRQICCGSDSALGDAAQKADPTSLPDVAHKLDGRHVLSDGRPIMIKAQSVAPDAAGAGQLLNAVLMNHHAALAEWNSHLYVVHGVVYMWLANSPADGGGGTPGAVIHKLLLWDTRYSDSRRNVVINRDTGDLDKLQGLLIVQARLQ